MSRHTAANALKQYISEEEQLAERRAPPIASTSGRENETVPRDTSKASFLRGWHSRPAGLRKLDIQFSSRPSGGLSTPTSPDGYPSQVTPRTDSRSSKLSFESRLRPQGSADLLSRRPQKESLLELLKQRAGSQELSSQGLSSLLNAPTPSSSSHQAGVVNTAWWPFTSGYDLPMAIPAADPNLLPKVEPADFQPYLKSCASRLAKFEAVRKSRQSELEAEEAASFTPGDGLAEALSVVPAMFFKDDFSLARPETWQEVLSTEDEGQRLARVEGYNNYVDIVESQLGREIAALQEHSTEFFQASSFLENLRASLQRAHSQVKLTRQQMRQVKNGMAKAAADVSRSRVQKANLEAVLSKLRVVEDITTAQSTIDLLLPQGDFAGALDVLDSLRNTCNTHPVTLLHAFKQLPSQITSISEAIDSLLSSEFIRATQFQQQPELILSITQNAFTGLTDLHSYSLPAQGSATPAVKDLDSLEDELTPLVLGLKRTNRLVTAISLLRSAAAEEMKACIRDLVNTLLESFPDIDKSSIGMTERLQALWPQQFLVVLRCVAQISLASIAHIKRVAEVVEQILKASKSGRSLPSSAAQEFVEVKQAVSEAAHSQWIKILASRSFLIASLDLPALKLLFEESESFANAMQGAGCRPVPALRNATQVQGRAFLDAKHASLLEQLSMALKGELWSAVGVPPACQAIMDSIISRAGLSTSHTPSNLDLPTANGTGEADKLAITSHAYKIAATQLLLLRFVAEYLDFLDIVPSLAVEVAHRIVELIKVFNGRMCQLVLGAGAMQVAGLKSITAKHLALSCQCVGALMELHPLLVASLSAKLPISRRALITPEFNLLLQDLSVHRAEIHSKLVGIMRERLIASLKQLPALATTWESEKGADQPSPFSQSLIKQLRTLATVVSPLLLEEEVQSIFGRLGSLYSKNLAEAFSRIEPAGTVWKLQARADLEFLKEGLRGLPMPASQSEQVLERMNHLLETRYLSTEGTDPTPSQQPQIGPRVKLPSVSASRKLLTERLNVTKMSLFNRPQEDAALQDGFRTAQNGRTGREISPGEDQMAAKNGERAAKTETRPLLDTPPEVDNQDSGHNFEPPAEELDALGMVNAAQHADAQEQAGGDLSKAEGRMVEAEDEAGFDTEMRPASTALQEALPIDLTQTELQADGQVQDGPKIGGSLLEEAEARAQLDNLKNSDANMAQEEEQSAERTPYEDRGRQWAEPNAGQLAEAVFSLPIAELPDLLNQTSQAQLDTLGNPSAAAAGDEPPVLAEPPAIGAEPAVLEIARAAMDALSSEADRLEETTAHSVLTAIADNDGFHLLEAGTNDLASLDASSRPGLSPDIGEPVTASIAANSVDILEPPSYIPDTGSASSNMSPQLEVDRDPIKPTSQRSLHEGSSAIGDMIRSMQSQSWDAS